MKKIELYRSLSQSTVEYAVLLAIVASAFIVMQVFVKRGIQGKIKDLADQISPLSSHYERGETVSNSFINQTGIATQRYDKGVTKTNETETVKRSSNATVTPSFGP